MPNQGKILISILTLFWSVYAQSETSNKPLNLQDATRIVMARAPEIELARLRIEGASIANLEIYEQILPRLSARYNDTLHPREDVISPNLSISISQPIPNPWELNHVSKKNDLRSQLEELWLRQVESRILEELRVLFYATWLEQQRLDATLALEKLFKTNKDNAQTRWKRGLLGRSDYNRIELDYLRIQSRLEQRKLAHHVLKEQLANLLGQSIDKLSAIETEFPQWLRLGLDYNRFQNELMKKHKNYELEIQNISKLRAERDEDDIFYELWPVLGLGYQYNRLLETGEDERFLTLSATWQIYAGKSRYRRSKALSNRTDQLEVELRQTREQFQRDLFSLLGDLQQSLVSLELGQKEEKVYLDLNQEAQQRFNQGLIDATSLSRDVQDLLESQDRLANTRLSLIRGWARLSSFVGYPELFEDPMSIYEQ